MIIDNKKAFGLTLALFLAMGSMQKTHAMDIGKDVAPRAEKKCKGHSVKWAYELAQYQSSESENDRDLNENPGIVDHKSEEPNPHAHDMTYKQ